MTTDALNVISNAMSELGIEYDFMERKSEPVYPYFTGEYTESDPLTEDGLQECTFILNGFTRGTWLSLEEAKNKIEQYFNKVSGKTVIAESGNAVAVFYSSSLVIHTGDAELKRIQINLTVKEWSVK